MRERVFLKKSPKVKEWFIFLENEWWDWNYGFTLFFESNGTLHHQQHRCLNSKSHPTDALLWDGYYQSSPFRSSLTLVTVKNTQIDPLCSKSFTAHLHIRFDHFQSSSQQLRGRTLSYLKALTLSKSIGGHTPKHYSPAVQESLSLSILKVHTKRVWQFDFGAGMHRIQCNIGIKSQRLSYKDNREDGDCIEVGDKMV